MDPFNEFLKIDRTPTPSGAPVPPSSRKLDQIEATQLELKVERLSLITHALWELLKERHGYTNDELTDFITLTDLKDGRLDGRYKVNTPPRDCPKCGRVVGRHLDRCIYCGTHSAPPEPFDRVV